MYATLKNKNNEQYFFSLLLFPPVFFFFPLGGGGGWVGGLCWWWCESRRSQPDQRRHICSLRYHHLLPSLPLNRKTKKTATVFSPQWPTYTLPGVTASTSAHARSHTISHCGQSVSLSRRSVFFFLFCLFFSLFWGFLLLLLGKGRTFFHSVCVNFFLMGTEMGRGLIVREYWGGEEGV